MKYWLQGLPFSGNMAKPDTGSVTYWLQGLPFAYSGTGYVPPPPATAQVVRSFQAARLAEAEDQIRHPPRRLVASLLIRRSRRRAYIV